MRLPIRVSMRRGGLGLIATRESTARITIPIMYLPRSTPPSQVQLCLINDPLLGCGIEEDQFVTVDLQNSNSTRSALEKLQMSAQVFTMVPICAKRIYTN